MKKTFCGFWVVTLLFVAVLFAVAQIAEKMPVTNEMKSGESISPLKNPAIIVRKKERKLFLYDDEKLVKTYKIGLGFAPVGDKEKEGDGKTPEGEFYIFTKNPKSSFYLSLGVSYPGVEDAQRGLKSKLITKTQHDAIIKANNEKTMPLQKTKLGGEIYIHGNGSASDWTWGCIALEDADMKELYDVIPVGAKITIER